MQNTENIKENRMGTMPVNRLLVTMSLPMVISMLVQALYNIVDSMFVSWIHEDALTAVSMAFPLQMLMIAVAAGTGVGVNALLSKSLGEKNFKAVNRAAENGIFLMIISYIVFAMVGIFVSRTFFAGQSDNARIVEYGTQYLSICLGMSFGCFFQMMMERLLQSTGLTLYTMVTQGIGAIINIILDPILIFGYFGFPEMGVAGAALATVTGQIVAAILAIYFNIKKNHEIHVRIRGFRPHAKTIRTIYWVGIPSIIMQAVGSVMTYGMNKILMPFSSTAVAVFGVYFKLNSFIFMPIFGLNNGLIPIVAYNYGARHKDRIMKTFRLAVCISVSLMAIGVLIFQFMPDKLLAIFKASDHMLEIGVPALRIISVSFVFAGFCIIVTSMLQSFGEGFVSLLISVIRQLVVLLPAAFVLSRVIGIDGIWWSFPIAEIASVSLSIFFFIRLYRKKISKLEL